MAGDENRRRNPDLGPQVRNLYDRLRGHFSGRRQHQHADHEYGNPRALVQYAQFFYSAAHTGGKPYIIDHDLAGPALGQGISPFSAEFRRILDRLPGHCHQHLAVHSAL